MGFKQKSFIDLEIAKKELTDLLGVDFDELKSDFQETGASGNVHKMTLLKSGNPIKNLILKKEEFDFSYFELYKNILAPFDLNSPNIYGSIKLNETEFLVMDYINYLPVKWDDPERSLRAVDWLVKKDLVIKNNLETVRNCPGVNLVKTDKVSAWMGTINDGVILKIHELIDQNLLDQLLKHESFLHRIVKDLSGKDNPTLNHNDLQMNNILFTKDGETFVIDWSEPNIGNVCVDLAHLVGVSPQEVHSKMIEKYKHKNGFVGFDKLFLCAQLLDHLGNLNWMVSTFLDGQGKNISVEDMKNRIDFILNFKYV